MSGLVMVAVGLVGLLVLQRVASAAVARAEEPNLGDGTARVTVNGRTYYQQHGEAGATGAQLVSVFEAVANPEGTHRPPLPGRLLFTFVQFADGSRSLTAQSPGPTDLIRIALRDYDFR